MWAPDPAKQTAALDRLGELDEAIAAKGPDIITMAAIRTWFGKNLPELAGTVVSLLVSPLVGKAVEAVGRRC